MARPPEPRRRARLEARVRPARIPLSLAQRGLWIVHEFDHADTSYHTLLALRLYGDVDVDTMATALEAAVVDRHEALRTSFPADDHGEPHQVVHATSDVPVVVHDLTDVNDPGTAVRDLVDRYQLEPYDLTAYPPTRCGIARLSDAESVLVVATHHIVSDAVSNAVLIRDLDRAFRRARGEDVPEVSPLPVQYIDYTLWQKERITSGGLDTARARWAAHLEGVTGGFDPKLLSPSSGWGPDTRVTFELSAEQTERLRTVAADVHATPFMVVFTAWAAALSRLDPNARGDFVIGVPVDGRSTKALEDLIGLFVTMVPVRVGVDMDQSFADLLVSARDALLEAYANAEVPIEWIVRDLALPRQPARPPLIEVTCQLQHSADERVAVGRHRADPIEAAAQNAKFQLSLNAVMSATATRFDLSYPRDRFPSGSVEALARNLREILERVIAVPGTLLRDLPRFEAPELRPCDTAETPVRAMISEVPAAEREIAKLFAETLGHEVEVTDGFFDVGGHSLLGLTVMRKLRKRHGEQLPMNLIFAHPTPRELAAAVADLEAAVSRARYAEPRHDVGCWLPPLPEPATEPPLHVLVTGATGLMGAHVCAEVLETRQSTVWCLVRADSVEAGRRRLVTALRRTGRWRSAWNNRVRILVGDLASPWLGLSETDYADAAETVDLVLHVGASTNLLDSYERARGPNVLGTREILWFATTKRLKPVHYVSTISTLRAGPEGPSMLPEDWRSDPAHIPSDGYVQTKWVAEETVRQAAGLGMPAVIYRPSRIAGDVVTATSPADDAFWAFVLACIEVGAEPTGPQWRGFGDRLVPVDHLSRVYVRIAFSAPSGGGCYNLANPASTTLAEVLDVARTLGYVIEQIPGDTWVRRVDEASADPARRSRALESVLLLIEAARREESGAPRTVSTARTDTVLHASGLAWPDIEAGLIERYLRAAVERGELLAGALDTDSVRIAGIWELWEEVVRSRPHDLAAKELYGSVTVAELDEMAAEVAAALAVRGIGRGDRVGIKLRHGIPLLAVILGVVRVGAAFVPVDHRQNDERSHGTLARAQVCLTVADDSLIGEGIVTPNDLAREGQGHVPPPPQPGEVAYVLFTSGSTGEPKGVVVPHDALAHYLSWVRTEYVGPRPRGAPLYSSVAFDLTVTSLFGPLVSGGTVYLVPPEDGIVRVSEILREGASFDFIKATPTHLRILVDELAGRLVRGHVRALVVGGESLPPDLVEAWRNIAPDTVVYNEYGPTEATVGCCVHRLDPDVEVPRPYPIGTPLPWVDVAVCDPAGTPVPPGQVGELVIGGPSLAWGYDGRPADTARCFVADPSGADGARRYRTGDLVSRRLEDGVLVFQGRNDDQVKIRGHRVELEEVATALRGLPSIRDCVVRPFADEFGARLVAYVVLGDPAVDVVSRLLSEARKVLPRFMVPAEILAIDAIPTTVNGKVDTARLPVPGR